MRGGKCGGWDGEGGKGGDGGEDGGKGKAKDGKGEAADGEDGGKGEAKDGKMPMQAYARFLSAHSTPAVAIVTNMRFDENSSVPKLFFKAVRPLDEDELKQVVVLKDSPETTKAITMTVSQTDGVEKSAPPKPAPKKKAEPAPLFATEETGKVADEPVDEPVDEPTKVVKKSAPAPKGDDDDLSSIIDQWDDED